MQTNVFCPCGSRDLRVSSSSPQHPAAAVICHRAEPLPSVYSNSSAVGRIWHGHKGPLFVPEVGHTMQSFPLVTQSWVSTAGLETLPNDCNPQTQIPSPFPTQDPSSNIKYCRMEEKEGSSHCFFGALIPVNSNQTCSKDGSGRLLKLCPQSLWRAYCYLDTTRPPEYKDLQFLGIFLSSRGQKLGR